MIKTIPKYWYLDLLQLNFKINLNNLSKRKIVDFFILLDNESLRNRTYLNLLKLICSRDNIKNFSMLNEGFEVLVDNL